MKRVGFGQGITRGQEGNWKVGPRILHTYSHVHTVIQ